MKRPVVLYICTEDWYFRNHRLDHARALMAEGFEVHVATRPEDAAGVIAAAGCIVHPIEVERGLRIGPRLIRDAWTLARVIARVRPDVVHAVSLKVVGLLLASTLWFRRTRFILAVNGLGVSSLDVGFAIKALGLGIRIVSRSRRVVPLFQNSADPATLGVPLERVEIIPGVGVDLARFTPTPVPAERPFRAVYLGRAVRSKGLLDLAAVAARPDVRAAGIEVHLYCAIDATSPGTLDPAEIERIGTTPGIVLHPHTDNPAAAIADGHVAVLASHGGEGVSKFRMESLAVGRPVVASRSAGTDALVEEGVTGWTFAAGDTADLARVLTTAAACPHEQLDTMGEAGRALVEERFDLRLIAAQIVALHRRLADRSRRS